MLSVDPILSRGMSNSNLTSRVQPDDDGMMKRRWRDNTCPTDEGPPDSPDFISRLLELSKLRHVDMAGQIRTNSSQVCYVEVVNNVADSF